MNRKPASFLTLIVFFTIGCGKLGSPLANSPQNNSTIFSPIESFFSGPSSTKTESTWSKQKKQMEEQKRLQEKRLKSYNE